MHIFDAENQQKRAEEAERRIGELLDQNRELMNERDEARRGVQSLRLELEEARKESATHWANFCERSGDRELFELNRKHVSDLLASQAREQELRAVVEHARNYAGTLTGRPHSVSMVPWDFYALAERALARPSDTSALRELMLKVAHEVSKSHDRNGNPEVHKVIVDDVLNDGHPLADAFEAAEGPMGEQPEPEPDPKKETP